MKEKKKQRPPVDKNQMAIAMVKAAGMVLAQIVREFMS
jgi:hypothetical protein